MGPSGLLLLKEGRVEQQDIVELLVNQYKILLKRSDYSIEAIRFIEDYRFETEEEVLEDVRSSVKESRWCGREDIDGAYCSYRVQVLA